MSLSDSDPETPRRTHPLGFVVQGLQGVQRALIPILVVGYSMRGESFELLAALALGAFLALLGLGGAYLSWQRLTYTVGDTDIRVESGILSRAARSVPFERIQDVSLEQSVIPRLFGLVQLRFETGAGGKDELTISYLSESEGERLREVVRARKEGIGEGEALVAEAVAEPATILFAMNSRRLLTYGLFEFSLAVVAVIGGAVQTFGDFLPFNIWELEEWQRIFASPVAEVGSLGPSAQVIGGILGFMSLLVIGVLTGLVRTALREWNFLLERTAKGFRRRRGLLTRTDVIMPAHRVQAMRIGTGVLRRRFGWHGLSFVSLAHDNGSSNHIVAPFGQMREIEPIIASAGFERPSETLNWQRGARTYRIDNAIVQSLLLALVAITLVTLDRSWLAFLPLSAAILFSLRQFFLWHFERNALSPEQVFAASGWLAPQMTIASRVKLQSVEISQHMLGRRRGYATLHLGLAGGKLALQGIPLERTRQLRDAILSSIGEKDFSRLV